MKNFSSVILIDDDPVNNALNRSMLEKVCAIEKIHVCETGFEGIVLVRRLSVENSDDKHLLFLDLNMRGMNGFEFLLEFKNILIQNKNRFRIVVLSNSESIRDRITIFTYISMPWSFFHLKKYFFNVTTNIDQM